MLSERSSSVALAPVGILWGAFALQWLATLAGGWMYGTAIGKFFWLTVGLPDVAAFNLDRLILILVSAGIIASAYMRRATGLWIAACWIFAESVAVFTQGGSFGAPYTLFAHAVRYGLPLALGLRLMKAEAVGSGGLGRLPGLILMICISLTFITHGIEALSGHPGFKDYIIRFFREWWHLRVSETSAGRLLLLIGVQDIILGLGIFSKKLRVFLLYMAVWGFWTAFLRFLHSPETGGALLFLIRAANGGVPLALFLAKYSPKVASNFLNALRSYASLTLLR